MTGIDAFSGFYINLDRKPERRRRMEAELRRFKLTPNYERVSAVDGVPGAPPEVQGMFGCFRSHLKVLAIGLRSGRPLHILEDDAILSAQLRPFLALSECAAALSRYDLVFLSVGIKPNVEMRYREALMRASQGFQLLDLRGLRLSGTDSYLVAARSVGKVAALLRQELASGQRVPIDVFYRRAVDLGLLKAAVVIPFITCIDIVTGSESTIQTLSHEEHRFAIMLRTAFFVDRNRQPSLKLPPLQSVPG